MRLIVTFRIFLGVFIGIALGILLVEYTFPNLESIPKKGAQHTIPPFIEARGILREYDAVNDTIIVDILSPYTGRTTMPIKAHINNDSRISYTPIRFESESDIVVGYEMVHSERNSLRPGAQIYLSLLPSDEGFLVLIARTLTLG